MLPIDPPIKFGISDFLVLELRERTRRINAMRLGRTTRIDFNEIKRKKVVRGQCYSCGKKMQRTFSDWQTVNPFNKNADGSVKTAAEISRELEQKLNAKIKDAVLVCRDCEI